MIERRFSAFFQKTFQNTPKAKKKLFGKLFKNFSRRAFFKSKFVESYYRKIMLPYLHGVVRQSLVLLLLYNCTVIVVSTYLYTETTALLTSQSIITPLIMVSVAFVPVLNKHKMCVIISIIAILFTLKESLITTYNLLTQIEIMYTPTLHVIMMIFTILPLDLLISVPISILSILFLVIGTMMRISSFKNHYININDNITLSESYLYKKWHLNDFLMKNYTTGQLFLWSSILLNGIYMYASNRLWRRIGFLTLGETLNAKKNNKLALKGQIRWIDAIMPSVIREDYLVHLNETITGQWLYIKPFENVSILFADIVGFTKLSSNKTAEDVVKLLNDLFNRFDDLCTLTNCEKLGTLGDCYYCVAGCPLPRQDHSMCCIEMGLAMCTSIKAFNAYHNEDINMRVGVHTGRVNAAIIGKCRFRFDVYSNDVLIANALEGSGKPGYVHISETTYQLVSYAYNVIPGKPLSIKQEHEHGISGTTLKEIVIDTFFIDPKGSMFIKSEDLLSNKLPKCETLRIADPHTSYDETAETVSISFDERPLANERVSLIKDQHIQKIDKEVSFIENLQEDPNHLTSIGLNLPINMFTLCFNDPEIEWHYQNHVVDQVQNLELYSAKLSPFIESIIAVFCLCLLTLGAYAFFNTNLMINISLILIICLKFELSLLEMWKATTYYSLLKHKCMKVIYIILSHSFIKGLFCIMSMTLSNLTVIIFYNCYLVNNCYYYQTRFFSLALFAMFAGSLHISSVLIVKFIGLTLNFIFVLYFVCLKSCNNERRLIQNYSPCNCIGNNDTFEYGIYMNLNRFNYAIQLTISFIVLILIIREREVSQRRWFFVTREAEISHEVALRQMHVARDFLFNIIPKYVFIHIGANNKRKMSSINYAVSVEKAGVVFACISNFFSSYYREDYKGGSNALKILNAIISKFDDLLYLERYKDVEKIKSINDCYMLASGLNIAQVSQNDNPVSHLIDLMNFAFDIIHVINDYNEKNVIGFQKFKIKIGYNVGTVTAGIIGNSKPMYDIWGDTVNVASRMYSTSEPGDIQVPYYVAENLKMYFVFKYRDEIDIKGKGKMKTYLCIR